MSCSRKSIQSQARDLGCWMLDVGRWMLMEERRYGPKSKPSLNEGRLLDELSQRGVARRNRHAVDPNDHSPFPPEPVHGGEVQRGARRFSGIGSFNFRKLQGWMVRRNRSNHRCETLDVGCRMLDVGC